MSAVQRFYELEDAGRPAAKGKICNFVVSHGSSNTSSYNTTNLIPHLKKHEGEYKEYIAAIESKAGLKQKWWQLSEFCGAHKADNVVQAISHVLQEEGLDKQRLNVILRNNACERRWMTLGWQALVVLRTHSSQTKFPIVFSEKRMNSPSSGCTLKMNVCTLEAQFYISF